MNHIKKLQETNNQLKADIEKLEKEAKALREVNENLNVRINSLTSTINDCGTAIGKKDETIKKLESLIVTSQNNAAGLMEVNKEQQSVISALQLQLSKRFLGGLFYW